MKILYVVSRPLEINTSASIRNKATIQGLIENGNEVTLLTSVADKMHPSYDDSFTLDGLNTIYVKLTDPSQLIVGKLRGIKFKKIIDVLEKIWKRYQIYDNLKSIVSHTDAITSLSEYDLIISSSDPKSSHLYVYNILKYKGKLFHGRWIQIWGDPFVGDISSQCLESTSMLKRIEKEEIKLLSRADRVIYVSKMTLEKQSEIYPNFKQKMTFIPIPYLSQNIALLRNLPEVKKVYMSFCGDYSSHIRNIIPLYTCIKEMPNIHLTICGWSDLNLASTGNIDVLPRQNLMKVNEIESKADILIHLSNLHGSQIPGKIYQYLGTNKPILFILDGNSSAIIDIFEKYNRFVFTYNEKSKIELGIKKIIESDKISYTPLEDFSASVIAKSIIMETKECINDCTSE